MCGIAGIFSTRVSPADRVARVERMCAALIHRGPDEGGQITRGPMTLGVRRLAIIDLWDNQIRHVDLAKLAASSDCRVCKHREFVWLSGERNDSSAVLCGRNAVQLSASPGISIALDELASRLAGIGRIERNAFLVRLHVNNYILTVFADGRTIVGGTNDIATARTVQARYIGA